MVTRVSFPDRKPIPSRVTDLRLMDDVPKDCHGLQVSVRVLTASMASKRVQLFIRGRVQGVFFRAATQREARRLGIGGWVKNRNDGSIEIVAEGEEESIKELVGWAQHGPTAARVENVDVRWRGYTGEFAEFRIVE